MKCIIFFAITWTFVALSQAHDRDTNPAASSCKKEELCACGKVSKAYQLTVPGFWQIPVYCHMTHLGACGGDGWTLVMKIDGRKSTFDYDSNLWSNKKAFNVPGGQTGLDSQETKLPTYWSTPFTKICLGMKVDGRNRFILINKQASSLYSLIADGQYRATSLGRYKWKSLIGFRASLQLKCGQEGFNTFHFSSSNKARIGILGNQEDDCETPDSRIGFGTAGYPDHYGTCGNAADDRYYPDNGGKKIRAMGYIFVQ